MRASDRRSLDEEAELEAEAQAFGAPPEMLGDSGSEPEVFSVLPECWTALRVFLASASQWVELSDGVMVGLSYPGVEIAIQRLGIESNPEDWARFQVIEAAATAAINEARRKRQR